MLTGLQVLINEFMMFNCFHVIKLMLQIQPVEIFLLNCSPDVCGIMKYSAVTHLPDNLRKFKFSCFKLEFFLQVFCIKGRGCVHSNKGQLCIVTDEDYFIPVTLLRNVCILDQVR